MGFTVKRRGVVGRVAQSSAAGANRHRFFRRIGHRALKPGKYRVTLVATDAAGNRSAAHRLRFTVASSGRPRGGSSTSKTTK